jgi:hypothetical protein
MKCYSKKGKKKNYTIWRVDLQETDLLSDVDIQKEWKNIHGQNVTGYLKICCTQYYHKYYHNLQNQSKQGSVFCNVRLFEFMSFSRKPEAKVISFIYGCIRSWQQRMRVFHSVHLLRSGQFVLQCYSAAKWYLRTKVNMIRH